MSTQIPTTPTTPQVPNWRLRQFYREQRLDFEQCQNGRYQGFGNSNRARNQILIYRIYQLTGAKDQAKILLRALKEKIIQLGTGDLSSLQTIWTNLTNAQTLQDLQRYIYQDITPGTNPESITGEPLVEVPTFLTQGPTISPSDDSTNENLVNNIVDTYTVSQEQGKLMDIKEAFKQIADTVGKGLIGISSYLVWNKIRKGASFGLEERMVAEQTIPCVVGLFPVPHVQEIEVARSGKILKFRATGSVFLANQEGGLEAIRVEGYLYRTEIQWILWFWLLFSYGEGEIRELPQIAQNPYGYGSLIDTIGDIRKVKDVTRFNRNREKPSYEYHSTFPFVTRHVIIPNCYIETLSFEEKVVFGKDCIGFTMFLRTYTAPRRFNVYNAPHSVSSYFAPALTRSTQLSKLLSFTLNVIWRTCQQSGIIIKEQEWKIRNDQEGNDVTYDIDAEALAYNTILSLAGVIGVGGISI